MEYREMMWDLFISTGNLDAYLAYRACVCPEASPGAPVGLGSGAYYLGEKAFGVGNVLPGGE